MQNFKEQYASQGFQGQQQGSQIEENPRQRRSQSFEDQMLTFMGENKRLPNIHEQKFSKPAAFQENTNVFQANTNAYLKNLETQVGQLALAMQNQSKEAFLSGTKKNPKDYMVVTLRSAERWKAENKMSKKILKRLRKKKLEKRTS